jgi:cysteinyl-tRNA synthetase
LRYFILTGKYSNPADYSAESLAAASKGVERLETTLRRIQEALKHAPQDGDEATQGRLFDLLDQTRMLFTSAMNDDFNTPLALSALFEMGKEVNNAISSGIASRRVLEQADAIYRELGGQVLGVVGQDSSCRDQTSAEREEALIHMLIEMRNEARKAKDYARADAIRERLSKLGIVLEDGPQGTTWRIIS